MSLNEGVMDDIEDNDLVGDGTIHTPNTTPAQQGSVNILVKSDDVTEDVTKLSEDQLKKLPLLDTTFQLVNDNVSKVVDLQDVESSILARESIDKSGAKLVDEVFTNLFSKGVSLEEFTRNPSMTNFQYVKNHMKNRIAQESNNLIASFQLFLDQPLNDAKEILNGLTNNYIDALVSEIQTLQNELVDFQQTIQQNKNTVVQYGTDFVNLSTLDIGSIDFSKVSGTVCDNRKLSQAAANIKQLFGSLMFKLFLFSTIDSKPVENIFDRGLYLEYSSKPITIIELSQFFTNTNTIDNLRSLVVFVKDNISVIDKVQSESDKHKVSPEAINAYLIENNKEIQDMIVSVQSICYIVSHTSQLVLNSKAIFDYFKKF